MDIQLEKYKLVEWLVNIKDIATLKKIKQLKEDSITEVEKSLIDAGIKDYENDNTFSHEQVMNELKEKYGI